MEGSATSASLCSSGNRSHENEKKIVPSSTSQLSIARSAIRRMWNVYTFLISSSVFCVLIRLGLHRLFNLFNSKSNNQSPSSSATPPSAGNQSPSSCSAPESTDASHPSRGGPYDVFLNHRGPDVKKSLASGIYLWLQDKGLRVFLDQEEFRAGDGLNPTIEEAINSASVQIPIFSERYAESSWCLDELCLMLKSGAKIIPVFYDVRPSDLRWIGVGKGAYEDAFATHENKGRFLSEKLNEWKAALKDVSNLHGLELYGPKFNGDSGKLSKGIVDAVLGAVVNKGRLDVPEDPVGLDEAVEDFRDFVGWEQEGRNEAVRIVGIVGFGGSGKTTLAKQFYNLQRSSFDGSSFLFDVRDASAKSTLQRLQSQLLKDVFHIDQIITSVSEGKAILRDRLRSRRPRVLIVLDDIDHESQIEDLVADSVLGCGSLILITSRDEGPLRRHSDNASVYKIKALDPKHARELFCMRAFKQPQPKIGFEDLVEEFCSKCGRLPLFLKVMGAHLRVDEKDDIDGWKNKLEYMPDDIKNILKTSYDVLSEEERQIFLDVACFFLREDKSRALRVWNRTERWGSTSLKKLENKCLVEIDDKKCLKMHDHLRDFGKEIANKASPFRFWHLNQITDVLLPFQGRMGVRSLVAVTDESDDRLTCNHTVFEKIELSTLKFLAIQGDCLPSRFVELSTNLTMLRWLECPHKSIPSLLMSMKNLTVLQITGKKLEEWEMCEKQHSLKELTIRHTRLAKISILEDVCPHLELLDLSYNEYLIEVEHLPTALTVLNLNNCTTLNRITGSFHLKNLRQLRIEECGNLEELPNLKYLSSLETLHAGGCWRLQAIQGLEHLRKLSHVGIRWCSELRELPNLSDLSSLEKLRAHGCDKLQSIEGLEHLLKLSALDISGCSELGKLPNLSNLSSLETLKAMECRKLQSIGGLEHMQKLRELEISGCSELCELSNLSDLSSLERLEADGCWKLQSIDGLDQLQQLRWLNLSVSDDSRAVLNSIQRLEKWPSTLLISAIGAASNDFSFPHLPVIDLKLSRYDSIYQFWTSEIAACAEEIPRSTITICFVGHCFHADDFIDMNVVLQRGGETWNLQRIAKRHEIQKMRLRKGDCTCVGVFSQFMESLDTSIHGIRLEVRLAIAGVQVKKAWTLTASEESKGRMLEAVTGLFTR